MIAHLVGGPYHGQDRDVIGIQLEVLKPMPIGRALQLLRSEPDDDISMLVVKGRYDMRQLPVNLFSTRKVHGMPEALGIWQGWDDEQ